MDNQDHLNLLRKIKNNPNFSQRKLANELGFSLGKLNYCLKALKSKGLIKIKNFKDNPNKFNYIYNGIFVSTELENKTNSCIGIFQNNKEYLWIIEPNIDYEIYA